MTSRLPPAHAARVDDPRRPLPLRLGQGGAREGEPAEERRRPRRRLGARCGRARRGARGARGPDARASCARTRSCRTSRTSSRGWSRTTLDEQAFRAVAHLTRRPVPRVAARRPTPPAPTLRAVAPGPHARDGGGGVQADVEPRSDDRRREVRRSSCAPTTRSACPGGCRRACQPNHPTDDVEGILASTREGLSYGCGDAVIGVNPATDTRRVDRGDPDARSTSVLQRNGIPTQHCVLSHVTVQMKALELGCPMDLMFQSLAGTEAGNRAFGDHRRAARRGVGR